MTSTPHFVRGFEFDRMAQRPLYGQATRRLVEHATIQPQSRVVDLGCGSGAVTQLVLERFPLADAADLRIWAVEPSDAELAIARRRIQDTRVTFVHAFAQAATGHVRDAGVVIFCNVIHQIPPEERGAVCAACFQMLAPGGRLCLSTPFYEGAMVAGTQPFYFQWMQSARAYLRERGVELHLPKKRPASLQLFSAEQYRDLLLRVGFARVELHTPEWLWRIEDWEALSHYSVFIEGALGDVDLELGSRALVEGARAALVKLKLSEIPRTWFYAIAEKSA